MSLTLSNGPLAADAALANFRIDGPAHRIHFESDPRRFRAELGGRTVLDTTRGALLHETGILPVLYAPLEDYDASLLTRSDHTTHCPFKGDASYWHVGEVENALWAYEQPLAGALWLSRYAALYHHRMDRWLEEDEEVRGGLRDPYHRVDARRSDRRVEVRLGGEVVARCERPVLLFETGVPVRAYIPRDGLDLAATGERTHCPYKGEATTLSLRVGDRILDGAAWSYEEPLDEARAIAGLVALQHDELEVTIA
ncbi:MAG TPA: DUF427 domain-containing protein [Capillimicrobium sp.]|jgi:uncharacterized protein (DUF427 family)